MELYEMLYQRLTDSEALSSLLAKYKGRPAIFYQRPATADDKDWGEKQYQRIAFAAYLVRHGIWRRAGGYRVRRARYPALHLCAGRR